jgi:TPR repeat protein
MQMSLGAGTYRRLVFLTVPIVHKMKKSIPLLCLMWSLSACSFESSIEDGIAAYNAKDYQTALRIFGARKDNVALEYLSEIYLYGRGVPVDEFKGVHYLEDAASKGSAKAQSNLADIYRGGGYGLQPDGARAMLLYQQAAANGWKEAYSSLGDLATDKAQKYAFYNKASGTYAGEYRLAQLSEFGDGGAVVQDPTKSLAHLLVIDDMLSRESSNFRMHGFKVCLAEYYYYGFGTPKDARKAFRVLDEISKRDDDENSLYAWLLFWGEGVAADPARAVRLWTSIADQGTKAQRRPFLNPYAYIGLGVAYTDGRGTYADSDKAAKFKTGSGVGVASSGSGEWLVQKFNALGYLDGKCRPLDGEVLSQPELRDKLGRYKSLHIEGLIATAKCLPKRTADSRVKAYQQLKEGAMLGDVEAARLAHDYWSNMSPSDQADYRHAERLRQLVTQRLRDTCVAYGCGVPHGH